MPKRKRSRVDDGDINYLEKKIRKLERKLRESRPAKRRRHGRSSSRSLSRRRRSKTRSYTRSRSRSRSHLRSRERSASPPDSRYNSHGRRDPEQSEVRSARDLVCSEQPEQISEVLPPPCNESEPACEPVIDTVLVEGAEDTQELDGRILEILGDDPTSINTFGSEIQKDLAVRLQHCVTNGLTKEIKKEFIEKYLTPSNCKLINAPALNAEIKAAIPETVAKRDKAIEIKQKQLASAITALCQALTRLLSSTEKDTDLIKLLMDTSRILCDCQYTDSVTRRNFVLSTLKKDMKDQVQTTKVDSFLFGENFADTIKTAKAITKSGAELKATTNAKMQSVVKKPPTGLSKNLNWKTPFPSRRLTDGPRTRESALTRNPPSSSSRPSQRRAPPRNTRR